MRILLSLFAILFCASVAEAGKNAWTFKSEQYGSSGGTGRLEINIQRKGITPFSVQIVCREVVGLYESMPVAQRIELTMAVVWQDGLTTSALDAPPRAIQRIVSEWYQSTSGGFPVSAYLDFGESATVEGRIGGEIRKTLLISLRDFEDGWDEFQSYCTSL